MSVKSEKIKELQKKVLFIGRFSDFEKKNEFEEAFIRIYALNFYRKIIEAHIVDDETVIFINSIGEHRTFKRNKDGDFRTTEKWISDFYGECVKK